MSQEYEFKEYWYQFHELSALYDINYKNKDPEIFKQIIALDNTVTGLESTRFPGNAELLKLRNSIRELLAKE